MKPTIIFHTTFTGRGKFDGFRGQKWFADRSKIFEKYTLKNLMSQTDKEFKWLITFRPQERGNPVLHRIFNLLGDSNIDYTIAFEGMTMWDDRAPERNKDLIERTQRALDLLDIKTDYVYETQLDSDDMVHKKFVEVIKAKPYKERGALFMRDGFVFNTDDRIAYWNNPTSQQNYTIMYPRDIYLDADKRYKYLDGLASHEEIPDKFDAEELPMGMFCSVIHDKNISTVWTHPFRKEEVYYDDERNFILNNFI